MRDFLPADKARREHALQVIRANYAAHGFDEIETPVMEESARLHSGLGGDNEKLSYAVMRRGLTTGDVADAAANDDLASLTDLGLRFDLTVPLSRFYASHAGHLPRVFRAIQIAPVWRAERPQKGRYRQFMQCDIDIIGQPDALAEIELLIATLSTLDALGLAGCTIRIGDRRQLNTMLAHLGFAADETESVLITIDKLDKVGPGGVIDELRSKGVTVSAVDALARFFDGSEAPSPVACTPEGIAGAVPAGAVDEAAVDSLTAIAEAVAQATGRTDALAFDPFLVRGMGYYTGTIFEIHHPDVPYSIGGGGRYDGMVGRFSGTDASACGISLGFERLVDLIDLSTDHREDAVGLVYDKDVAPATLARLKAELVSAGSRVRLVRRTKNMRALLERLAEDGYGRFAAVRGDTASVDELEFAPLMP